MKDIKATIVPVNGLFRISVTIDEEPQFLGRSISNILFKWIEYETEEEALEHIDKSERLYCEH